MSTSEPTMMENISNKLHSAGEKVVDMLPEKVQSMFGHEQDKDIRQPGKQYPLESASINKKITEDSSNQDWSAVKQQDDKVLGLSNDSSDKDQSTLGKVWNSVSDTIGSTYHSIKENVVGNEEARLRGHEQEDKDRPKWAVDEEEEGGLDTDDASFGLENLTDSNLGNRQSKRGQLKDFSVGGAAGMRKKARGRNTENEVGSKSITMHESSGATVSSKRYDPEPFIGNSRDSVEAFDAPIESRYKGGLLYGGKNGPGKVTIGNTSGCTTCAEKSECCCKSKSKKWSKGKFDEQRDLRVAAQKLGHYSEAQIKSQSPEQLEAQIPTN